MGTHTHIPPRPSEIGQAEVFKKQQEQVLSGEGVAFKHLYVNYNLDFATDTGLNFKHFLHFPQVTISYHQQHIVLLCQI